MTLPLFGQLELPLETPGASDEPLRRIHLGARVVEYRLVRRRRRTLAMSIDQRGLRVGAPCSLPVSHVEGFIRSNAAWVLVKLEQWGGAQRERRVVVASGTVIPVLGEACTLRVRTGADRVHWRTGELLLEPARTRSPAALLIEALRERALQVFGERVAHYARRLGLAPPALALSSAQTRWGSCSNRSGLRLNWRLIHLPMRLLDYVVAHELAHLYEMNHSPRFWAVVERVCSDHAERRAELKAAALTLPTF